METIILALDDPHIHTYHYPHLQTYQHSHILAVILAHCPNILAFVFPVHCPNILALQSVLQLHFLLWLRQCDCQSNHFHR
jgi:hypothetical protein